RLQARLGGGLAGHNGLRSIAQHLGTQDFMRLRIGVGRPERGDRRSLADFLLSDFEAHDDAETLVARAADAVETLDAEGLEVAPPPRAPTRPARAWRSTPRLLSARATTTAATRRAPASTAQASSASSTATSESSCRTTRWRSTTSAAASRAPR